LSKVVWEQEGGRLQEVGLGVGRGGPRRVVASLGVEAIAEFAKGGKKPSGCTLMGITPITDQP
jgi:hypothetical protein